MLFIFRKLRRSFFQPGKLRTYIAYALGEILLIVLGILIAVQIGNWNEGREETLEEQKVLTRLQEELDTHVALIDRFGEVPLRRKEHLLLIEDAFAGAPVEDPYVFLEVVSMAKNFGWTIPQQRRVTFDELVNSNKISLIKDTALRESIASYYHGIETNLHQLDFRRTEFSNRVYELLPMPDRNRIEEGLGSETYATLVEAVLNSDLHKYLTAEKNRCDHIAYYWNNYTETAKELLIEIESYQTD